MKKNVLDQIEQLDPRRVMRFCQWALCRHVASEVALESDSGRLLPQTSRDVEALFDIATAIAKMEAGTELLKMRASMNQPQGAPLSPAAQELSDLNEVDRHLLRAAAEKYISITRRELESNRNAEIVVEAQPGGTPPAPEG